MPIYGPNLNVLGRKNNVYTDETIFGNIVKLNSSNFGNTKCYPLNASSVSIPTHASTPWAYPSGYTLLMPANTAASNFMIVGVYFNTLCVDDVETYQLALYDGDGGNLLGETKISIGDIQHSSSYTEIRHRIQAKTVAIYGRLACNVAGLTQTVSLLYKEF